MGTTTATRCTACGRLRDPAVEVDAAAFVRAWWDFAGRTAMSAAEALELADHHGWFRGIYYGVDERGEQTSFAVKVLKPLIGREVGGLVLVRQGTGRNSLYRLMLASDRCDAADGDGGGGGE